MKFCIERGNNSREQIGIINGCRSLKLDYTTAIECPDDMIPIGSIPFCEKVFGNQPEIKDFFPSFIRGRFMSREMDLVTDPVLRSGMFYKSATEWKSSFASRICTPEDESPDCTPGTFWVSEPVSFVQEWRYYVAGGELVATGWYDGNDEEEPAPELKIEWPRNFSGAVDFGRLDTGHIELVEAHAPFACGHYCESHEDYTLWQYLAWESRDYWLI